MLAAVPRRAAGDDELLRPGRQSVRGGDLAPLAAEVTRQCSGAVRLRSSSMCSSLAIDGVLQPFELGLQMLEWRLERLHPALPGDLWRSRARSPPTAIATPPPRPTHRCLIVAGFGSAGRGLGAPWPVSEVSTAQPPGPLMSVAREEEGTRPNERIGGRPRGLDHCLGLRASARACASVAFGLGAEVLPAGSARLPTLLRFGGARMSFFPAACATEALPVAALGSAGYLSRARAPGATTARRAAADPGDRRAESLRDHGGDPSASQRWPAAHPWGLPAAVKDPA
jgi:hypothetical protein